MVVRFVTFICLNVYHCRRLSVIGVLRRLFNVALSGDWRELAREYHGLSKLLVTALSIEPCLTVGASANICHSERRLHFWATARW